MLALGIWEALKDFFTAATDFALGLGGPGLFLLALADSSFLSIPEGNDLLIVVKSTSSGWSLMVYFVAMTVLGSTVGCSLLYSLGRWGGSRVTSRMNKDRVAEISDLYRRRGVWTILVPSILPPPTPFKIFVLSAGVLQVRFTTFLTAVVVGRTIRYSMWGILAVLFGEAVHQFLIDNVKGVGIALLLLFVAILGVIFVKQSRKRKARANTQKAAALMVLVGLSAGAMQCKVKTTTIRAIPDAHVNARSATLEELVEKVNQRYADLDNLTFASLDVEFTGEAIEGGYIEEAKYRRAKGLMIASRPDSIYLNIKNPLTGSSLATMASQQRRFQIWVPRENKFFVGSTDVEFQREDPLLSVRPHHLLNGLLVERLSLESADVFLAVKEEEDSQFKYYVITVLTKKSGKAILQLIREVWFERSRMQLVRQKYFDNGRLEADIRYSAPVEREGRLINTTIDVERPIEQYRLRFELKPDAIRINRTLKAGTFEVHRPAGAQLVVVEEEAKTSLRTDRGSRPDSSG